uniref:Peptidyl-prolyl cis-trans isomerase n=1 Tax=Polytomella parva TaxID=51329 RepID=A0A7S0UUL1_9CHLO
MQSITAFAARRAFGALRNGLQSSFQKPHLLQTQKRTMFNDPNHISVDDFQARILRVFKANPLPFYSTVVVVGGFFIYIVVKTPDITDKVYFDIESDGQPLGRVVVGLFGDDVPRTAENFKQLTTGARGFGYSGSPIFHIIRNYAVLAGDVMRGSGHTGYSIYGPSFSCESKMTKTERGSVVMLLGDNDKVDSRFGFCLMEGPSLKDNSIAVGRVLEGLELLDKLSLQADQSGKPRRLTIFRECGLLPSDTSGKNLELRAGEETVQ